MPKTYTLERSGATGWWVWQCKDGSNLGSHPDRQGAKAEAEAACGIHYDLYPPKFNAVYYNGYLSYFSVNDLDGKPNTFSVGELTEEQFNYYFGIDHHRRDKVYTISDADKAIVCLKIWGVYKGGKTLDDIMHNHNISKKEMNSLVKKKYNSFELTIEDDGKYYWEFK